MTSVRTPRDPFTWCGPVVLAIGLAAITLGFLGIAEPWRPEWADFAVLALGGLLVSAVLRNGHRWLGGGRVLRRALITLAEEHCGHEVWLNRDERVLLNCRRISWPLARAWGLVRMSKDSPTELAGLAAFPLGRRYPFTYELFTVEPLSGGVTRFDMASIFTRNAVGARALAKLPRVRWLAVPGLRSWQLRRVGLGTVPASTVEIRELVRQFGAAEPQEGASGLLPGAGMLPR
jgi:hypothetical protein